jgi:hypothetical protein
MFALMGPKVEMVERVYSVLLSLDVALHPENAERYAALVEGVEGEPCWVDARDGHMRAAWEYMQPEQAQALHDRFAEAPLCGMMIELTMNTAWAHREER